jgi:hypothetical protein
MQRRRAIAFVRESLGASAWRLRSSPHSGREPARVDGCRRGDSGGRTAARGFFEPAAIVPQPTSNRSAVNPVHRTAEDVMQVEGRGQSLGFGGPMFRIAIACLAYVLVGCVFWMLVEFLTGSERWAFVVGTSLALLLAPTFLQLLGRIDRH